MARALEGPLAGRASEAKSEEEELACSFIGVSRGIISLASEAGIGFITESDCSSSVKPWIDAMISSSRYLPFEFALVGRNHGMRNSEE